MQIIELQESNSEWRKLIKEQDSLIFHTPEFKSLIEKTFKIKTHYIAAQENGKIITIFPFYYINHIIFGKKVISVAFLEYGGPCGDEKYVADIINYIYGRYANIDYIEIREGLTKYNEVLNKLMYRDTSYKRFVLNLTSEELLWKNLDKQKKKAIRNSIERSIKVREVHKTEINEIYKLYLNNMRSFGSPPYPKRFFENFYKYMVSNKLGKVIGSYHNKKLVSALLGYCYKDRVHIIVAVSDKDYLNYRPNEAMHWHFIKNSIKEGYKYFDFGRVREDSGQFRFKKEWGCKLSELNHYYLLIKNDQIPNVDPNNPKYAYLLKAWKKMPLTVTKIMGPWLRRGLGI